MSSFQAIELQPGATWKRFDFHVHSMASSDWSGHAAATPGEWFEACARSGLDAVVVADHNTTQGIAALRRAREDFLVKNPDSPSSPVIFPGIELTTADDIHALFIFDPEASEGEMGSILQIARVPADPKSNAELMAGNNLSGILSDPALPDCICIPAHINAKDAKGLLRLSDRQIENILQSESIFAVEWTGPWNNGTWTFPNVANADGEPKCFATVRGSDAHRLRAASDSSCWVKLQDLSLKSLKMALLDGRDNLRDGCTIHPATPPSWIKSITIRAGRFIGRPEAFTLSFNPAFNCLIGGRGAGKSTLIECIREVFARASNDDLPGDSLVASRHRKLLAALAAGGGAGHSLEFSIFAVFHHHGSDYRFILRHSREEIEVEVYQGGQWVPEESAGIRQRFPIQVFSQNQLIGMAETTETLFKEFSTMDASPASQDAANQTPGAASYQAFLQNCLARENLARQLAGKRELQARLSDVCRRIETMQNQGFAEVLSEYQTRESQASEVAQWEKYFADWDEKISSFRDALMIPPLSLKKTDGDLAADGMERLATNFRAAAQEASRVFEDVVAVALRDAIQKWESPGPERLRWEHALHEARTAYEGLRHNSAGEQEELTIQSYGHLIQQKQLLEKSLRDLDAVRSAEEKQATEARKNLHRVFRQRKRLTQERKHFINLKVPKDTGLELEVLPFQNGWSGGIEGLRANAVSSLRELLGRPDRFDEDFTALANFLFPDDDPQPAEVMQRRLLRLKRGLRRIANSRPAPGGFPLLSTVFQKNVLATMKVDAHARLAAWWPEDGLRVRYRRDDGSMIDIQDSSPGQKTAAVLAFLLSQGDTPLVIDQPEDDLDNRLIYSLVVGGIRNNKRRRQLILATHNANIVVNGNAELVAPLFFHKGQVHIKDAGSTQLPRTREAICDILEGGREAFRLRYRKIITA